MLKGDSAVFQTEGYLKEVGMMFIFKCVFLQV